MNREKTKSSRHIATGRLGEQIAQEYLNGIGYRIVAQNVRTPYGEIDLIAQQEETWVFVEVKTRRTHSLGPPEISVDARKQTHMLNAIAHYIQSALLQNISWRIDVIAIQLTGANTPPEITHFENALSC